MKYLICTLVLFFYCTNIHAQSKPDSACAQYHKGNFIYVDSTGDVIRVRRGKHQQREFNDSKGIWMYAKITWITDCEYRLEQIGTNSKSRRKYNHGITTVLISKPLGGYGYEYTCSCEGTDIPKRTGTMTQVYK